MVQYWEAGQWYNPGDRVNYEGSDYNVIQAHRSQGDWLPPQVPALYASAGHHEQHHEQHYGGEHQQHGYGDHQQQQQHGFQGGPPGYGGQVQGPPPPSHYSQSAGFDDKGSDSDDDEAHKTDKKKLAMEIAGGVGVAALIGGGIYAYTKHKSKRAEEAKREVWQENANQQTWAAGADARTREIGAMGNKPPVYWVLTEGDNIPQNAVQMGHEADGQPLYAARAFHESSLVIGKAGRHLQPAGANISYGGQSHTVGKYEILVGDPRAIAWKRFDGRPEVRGWQPVDGGREADGSYLFVGRSEDHHGSVQVGKVSEHHDCIWFAYGSGEVQTRPYYIAAYA